MDLDDGYLAMVRAILKGAAGEPRAAQLEIAMSLSKLFQAVPAWMLSFGTANNKGCTALTGLQTFQVNILHTGICKQWSATDDASVDLSLSAPLALLTCCWRAYANLKLQPYTIAQSCCSSAIAWLPMRDNSPSCSLAGLCVNW